MSGPEFLTVAEVAQKLRLSKMTVYRLAASGTLSAVRVGRSYRIAESAYKAYLKSLGYEEPAEDNEP